MSNSRGSDTQPPLANTNDIQTSLKRNKREQSINIIKSRFNQSVDIMSTVLHNSIGLARQAYMNSYPFNLADITGYRFPHIPRLTGSLLTGRLAQHSLNGGLHQFDEIQLAGKLAVEKNTGISYFYLGPNIPGVSKSKTGVLLVTPCYVQQLMLYNKQKVVRGELMDPFADIFDSHTLIPMPSNDTYNRVVKEWLDAVYHKDSLQKLALPLQNAMDGYIASLEEKSRDGTLDLQSFAEDLILKLVAKVFVGIPAEIPTENLRKIIEIGTRLTIDVNSQVALQTEKLKEKMRQYRILSALFNLEAKQTPTAAARELLAKEMDTIIAPHEKTIRATDNLVTRLCTLWTQLDSANEANQKSEKEENLDTVNEARQESEKEKNNVTGLTSSFKSKELLDMSTIFVGHIQIARVIQFTLMLLAENPEKLSILRQEIAKVKQDDSKWTYEEINQVAYLKMVIQEVLRLYPPIPINAKTVIDDICLGDIKRPATYAEYQSNMANRDKSRDVNLKKGDLVFIAPWVTQHLESEYENAQAFMPERFAKKNPDGTIDLSVCITPDTYAWYPFSLAERACKGQKVAPLEAMFAIANIVRKYDFKLAEPFQHPYQTEANLQLRHKGKVTAFFKPVVAHKDVVIDIGEHKQNLHFRAM